MLISEIVIKFNALTGRDIVDAVILGLILMVALYALREVLRLKEKLKEDYWTKDVIGRTINAKTGNDTRSAQKEQDEALKAGQEPPASPGIVCLCKIGQSCVVCESKNNVKERLVFNVKDFCSILEKNIDNDLIEADDIVNMRLGFSYVLDGENHHVAIPVKVFGVQKNQLPEELQEAVSKESMSTSEFYSALADHYRKKK